MKSQKKKEALLQKVDSVNLIMLIVVAAVVVDVAEKEVPATKEETKNLAITDPDVTVKKVKESKETVAEEEETVMEKKAVNADVEVVEANAQELLTQMLKMVMPKLILLH